MKKKNNNASEMLWDDSALIAAWNAQLERIHKENNNNHASESDSRPFPPPLHSSSDEEGEESNEDAAKSNPSPSSSSSSSFENGSLSNDGSGPAPCLEVVVLPTEHASTITAGEEANPPAEGAGRKRREREWETAAAAASGGEMVGGGGGEISLSWMPPIPSGIAPEVASMLRAWFTAGYETGKFAAATSLPRRSS